MKLLKILSIFSIFFSSFLTYTNALIINIENNSIGPLDTLQSEDLNEDTLNNIKKYYIREVVIKIINKNDEILKKKLNNFHVNWKNRFSNAILNPIDNKMQEKTSTEIDIPENWIIKKIELICNNVTYSFISTKKQEEILHKKDITFFFDYIGNDIFNLKFRPQILNK
ncbi:MAG: hypothetical protein Q8K37_02110 [Alphaproteobacteria bacterium]|nr:hypothetical protein [Alphaproteobacteria bacterium]